MTARAPAGTRPPFLVRHFGWLAALVTFVATVVACSWRSYPVVPTALVLRVQMPLGVPGAVEPLIVTGHPGAGDLLTLRYIDETNAVLAYDSWGRGGPQSKIIDFEPKEWRTLHVEMPSFVPATDTAGAAQPHTGELRVYLDGHERIRTEVPFYPRGHEEVYFGINPIGASAAPEFRGQLVRPNGHTVRGGRDAYNTAFERSVFWLRKKPLRLLLVLGVAAFAGWLAHLAARRHGARLTAIFVTLGSSLLRRFLRQVSPPEPIAPPRHGHRWFAGSAALCLIVFTWLVTFGSFSLNHAEIFGNFYDHQAASFLQGRLDVPDEAIGGEAFEARGKLYGYFGPTPALLRLPFALTGVAFGKLSRAFMLGYYLATLLAAYLILCEVTRRLREAGPHPARLPATPSAFATVTLTLSVGLGSTVFFLGTRALIFHEAILSGIAFALWSAWCSLRFLDASRNTPPARPRLWLSAFALALLSLHCRPPTGLFALTLLGCVALVVMLRAWPTERTRALRRGVLIGGLCAIGLFTLHGFAWLKFRIFDPAPLRISRPYMGNTRLDHIQGKSFHLSNLPFNFHAYVARPNLILTPHFPWLYYGPPVEAGRFPGARIDLPDHTVPLTYASPSLFFPATLGALLAFITRPLLRPLIACLWLAALPMTLALLAAVATAQRYTGDFCPLLITSAAIAFATFDTAIARLRAWLRPPLLALTAASLIVTAALSIHYQREILWGVPDEPRLEYQRLRRTIDTHFGVRPSPPP